MDSPSPLDDLFGSIERDTKPPRGSTGDEAPHGEDDRQRLRLLFGTPRDPSRQKHRNGGDGGDPEIWPEHNYNDQPQLPGEKPGVRPPVGPLSESTVWEINELLQDAEAPTEEGDPAPLEGSEATPIPWPTHDAPSTLAPEAWLDRLAQDEAAVATTEARLVRTLWGDPATVRAPLFDTTDVLWAKDPAALEAKRKAAAAQATAQDRPASSGLFARIAADPRAFAFKAAGLFIGLKLGVLGGYVVASFL